TTRQRTDAHRRRPVVGHEPDALLGHLDAHRLAEQRHVMGTIRANSPNGIVTNAL
ncbi:hypothetical protein TRAPUB_13863, partial [Trametes pubescens]